MASHMKSTSSTVTSSLILPEQRVLAVNDMTVRFANSERTVDAVRNLSFHVDRGETLAIVGESGSGKSVTSLALMRLVEHGGGKIVNGSATSAPRTSRMVALPAFTTSSTWPLLRRRRGHDLSGAHDVAEPRVHGG